jgi:uncharacterized protein
MKDDIQPNRLIHEKSPYLLQHAYNPVCWYPWGEEAFAKAKREGKPIFLSIGYSTCHWCHVMERESFEDEEVADYLNKSYVAIKVDREERPDIDHVYMTACQALTGQGGWPLTIVMTPLRKPFFAGTYFPKLSRYGRPGLMDVLTQLAEKWENDRERVLQASNKILAHIEPNFAGNKAPLSPEKWVAGAYQAFAADFDDDFGGFGDAPKFPTPHQLLFLLRYSRQQKDNHALEMVCKTLDGMRKGGIYDQIGGGFARYSTDEKWLVPHFEKMLYDNALLAMAYLEGYQVTQNEVYRHTVEDIFRYVLREMWDVRGGFYSAEDADSEGVEGRFYIWREEDIKAVLGADDARLYCAYYDITEAGNFEGYNIPNLIGTDEQEFCETFGLDQSSWQQSVSRMNMKLFLAREHRVHPYKDDKILTAWNGLMIAALAKAGGALAKEEYIEAAKKAYQFVKEELTDAEGRLLARYRDGEAKYLGFADDYANVVFGLVELYEATFDASYLKDALRLQDEMIRLFWDFDEEGFFLYGEDGENLIARPKQIYDGASPSANSVAAYNLLRLGHITGQSKYDDYAALCLEAFSGMIDQYPPGYTFYLLAVQFAYGSTKEIVISGRKGSDETKKALHTLSRKFLPECVVVFRPEDELAKEITDIATYVKLQKPLAGQTTIYLCENFACQKPRTDWEPVIESL